MDFITILLVFKGFTTIFVVVDRWSKFEHFIPLKYDFTSVVVFDTFIQNVKMHGIPKSIVSDHDKKKFQRFLETFIQSYGHSTLNVICLPPTNWRANWSFEEMIGVLSQMFYFCQPM